MKKISVFIFITISILLNAQTDPNLKWLHPSPQGWDLRWVKMWDANNWYFCGDYGIFMKTTDAGQTWITKNNAGWPNTSYPEINTRWHANAAWFFDQNNGIVVGSNTNGILRTTDGGETFDTLRILPGSNSGKNIFNIYFVNSTLGFLCGNTSYKVNITTDGGNSWGQVPNLPDGSYYDVYATDALNILTCSTSGIIYKTTDGGANWNPIQVPTIQTLYDLEFINATTGYVCGGAGFFKSTTDGGATWTGGVNTPLGETNYKIKTSGSDIYVAGNATNLFKSTDNGSSWITLNMNTPGYYTGPNNSMDVIGSNIIVTGRYGNIYKSTNSGSNWNILLDRETDGSSYRSFYVENSTGKIIVAGRWTVIPGTIIISNDGGNTWTASPHIITSDSKLLKMQMLNNNVGYFGGEYGYLAKTTDGAISLTQLTFPTLAENFIYNMDFINELTGWIVGGLPQPLFTPLVAKTTDGGVTWINQTPSGISGPQTQVDFIDANIGFMTGIGGFFKTTNGGTNWVPLTSPTTNSITSLKAFDANNIYISTSTAEFYKTSNSGVNWQSVTVPWGTNLGFGQAWYDMNNGIQFGTLGAVAKTSDAGQTWVTMNTGGWTVSGGIMIHPDTFYVGSSDKGQIHRYAQPSTQTTFQLSVNVNNGWNIVSVPGLHPTNQSVDTWWEYRDGSANVFAYSGGYIPVTMAVPGIGYWMKHSGDRTYNTGDEWPAGGIQIVTHDPIAGASGWNLIGGYELSVSASGVTTNPPGLQSGPIYKYSGGYQIATTLDPGYGYWMKLTGAGQIIIPEFLAKGKEPMEYFKKDWGRIIFTDSEGRSFTLYAVNDQVDLDQYDMPPSPPAGMFDIRYNSGRIAEDLSHSQIVEMQGIVYPVKVTVENMSITLKDESEKNISSLLKPGEQLTISDDTFNKITVLSGDIIAPIEYALEQNYPNPFNPSTTIKFSLPEATDVKVTIYNALGQKVAELVNGRLDAGHYSYKWNANNVSTGMYIYELRTNNFVSVKKMLLLK